MTTPSSRWRFDNCRQPPEARWSRHAVLRRPPTNSAVYVQSSVATLDTEDDTATAVAPRSDYIWRALARAQSMLEYTLFGAIHLCFSVVY